MAPFFRWTWVTLGQLSIGFSSAIFPDQNRCRLEEQGFLRAGRPSCHAKTKRPKTANELRQNHNRRQRQSITAVRLWRRGRRYSLSTLGSESRDLWLRERRNVTEHTLLAHEHTHPGVHLGLTDTSCRYTCSVYAAFLRVWQARHIVDMSTNQLPHHHSSFFTGRMLFPTPSQQHWQQSSVRCWITAKWPLFS